MQDSAFPQVKMKWNGKVGPLTNSILCGKRKSSYEYFINIYWSSWKKSFISHRIKVIFGIKSLVEVNQALTNSIFIISLGHSSAAFYSCVFTALYLQMNNKSKSWSTLIIFNQVWVMNMIFDISMFYLYQLDIFSCAWFHMPGIVLLQESLTTNIIQQVEMCKFYLGLW